MAVQISSPGVIEHVDVPVGAPGPGDAARAGRVRGDLRLGPRAAGRRAAGGVRALPGRARPRVVGRRRGGRRGRGPAARRPQGRRRGLPQLPGVRRVPERADDAVRGALRGDRLHPAGRVERRILRLPARLLHVLPDDADLRAAALLEPAACVAEACLLAAPVPGERVAVVGGGTLGLLSAQLLRASSPRELVVVARRAERAELARRMGADALVAPDDVRDRLRRGRSRPRARRGQASSRSTSRAAAGGSC